MKSRVLGLIMTRAWLGFQAAVGDWMLTWTSWPGAADKLREKLRVARDGMMLMTDGRIMPCRLSLLSDICDALMMRCDGLCRATCKQRLSRHKKQKCHVQWHQMYQQNALGIAVIAAPDCSVRPKSDSQTFHCGGATCFPFYGLNACSIAVRRTHSPRRASVSRKEVIT